MLDYRIQTFLVLYEEMNYHRTAELLNMTQPGVSQHIRFLERYYGIRLFQYDGRVLSRTKYADELKRYCDSIRAAEVHLRGGFVPNHTVRLSVGATKTIGEFVITSEVSEFAKDPNHTLDLTIDNTETLLQMLERSKLDFAVIEGVFDKSKYGYHLYKKEEFVGVCAKTHPFANKTVTLEDVFEEDIVVREPFSGTRRLLEHAIADRGFSLENFRRCSSVSHFSVICNLVANQNMITFAYEPVANSRKDLATFTVADMHISGEFNFVYCNESIAREKIALMFG